MILGTDLVKNNKRPGAGPVAAPAPAVRHPLPPAGRGRGGQATAFQGFSAARHPAAPPRPQLPNPATAARAAATDELLHKECRLKTHAGRQARITLAERGGAIPSAMERRCDPADLALIKAHYGCYANLLFNILLAFDAYFVIFWLFETPIGWRCPYELAVKTAIANCCAGKHPYQFLT